ncbi:MULTISPECIES: argininosuccinate lyase [Anaerococcus]|uniref:argininosuccinate lyase n=1 Tax=Anaerococcus TaxID=165779 RepID=UPI001AE3CA02|nr:MULTISPECIES: argininosuccinate lyase [Anaerococcus]MBP2070294.1 argininosuccinate lyase [Anaerococcus nagyae]MDU2565879.1 argininosuccinate lyase [Anaerococcus sp.]
MKLWSGMLSGDLDNIAEELNSSIKVDKRLVFDDIKGSIAHVKMLEKTNILKSEEAETIINGLELINKKLKSGEIEVDESSEDIHTFIEATLINEIGDLGKKMHTARSRNDQVATDLKLNLRDECEIIENILKDYVKTLCLLAEKNTDSIMPGYTHLQAAQPVTFAHHLMAYTMMGLRDIDRIKDYKKRLNSSPLGACALAGTSYPIDREFSARELGFDSIMQNSMDAVSDRDYVLELESVLSIIAIHLSRLSEELIIWSSQPFGFVKIDDMYSTGSSIMPQKKNPDMAELLRSKPARVIGNMNQSFIMMKGIPLAYAKDMQEDKEAIFDSIDTVKISLKVMKGQMDTLTVNKDKMLRACKEGFLNATDVADYLVNKGLAFRDAHHISARLVKYATDNGITLEEIDLNTYKTESDLFEDDIYDNIDIVKCLNSRNSLGGPAKGEVKRQIDYVLDELKNS